MIVVDLQPIPAQRFSCRLDGQNCTFNIYQRNGKIYLDLYVDENPVAMGCICHDRTEIIQWTVRGFSGKLFFVDDLGTNDPVYDGLGARYILMFASESEVRELSNAE